MCDLWRWKRPPRTAPGRTPRTVFSITAYESFVNLHEANLRALLDSGTPAHYRQCRTRQPTLDEIKLDVASSLNNVGVLLMDEV